MRSWFTRGRQVQHDGEVPHADTAHQVAAMRDAVRAARAGDLESRVPPMTDPDLGELLR